MSNISKAETASKAEKLGCNRHGHTAQLQLKGKACVERHRGLGKEGVVSDLQGTCKYMLLQALPAAALEAAPATRILDATNNQLTCISNQISHFRQLQRLDLAVNKLKSLPACLTQLIFL